jgi:hypothetical protein
MAKRSRPEPPPQRSYIVDPAKVRPRPEPRPEEAVWHHELVGSRLVEAAATVRRMPMNIWPKQYGTIWPHFDPMNPAERQQLFNELQAAGQIEAWQGERNRIRVPPSGVEIERMEQALGWIPRYLGNDRETAMIVGYWASKTYDIDEDGIPAPVRAGLREISRGLRRDRVPVRP